MAKSVLLSFVVQLYVSLDAGRRWNTYVFGVLTGAHDLLPLCQHRSRGLLAESPCFGLMNLGPKEPRLCRPLPYLVLVTLAVRP